MPNMSEFFKAKKTGQSANEASKSDKSRSEGDVAIKRYRNYYDINNTIAIAQVTDPHDEDNPNYNREAIFESLERNAEKIIVSNDGLDTLFVIVSHEGGQNFARERPIYPGENKRYFNVYELRLRSPTADLAYRVTEYPICCVRNRLAIFNASISLPIKTVAIDTILGNTDFTLEVDASGGNRIITLPTAASAFVFGSGRIYNIKKIDNTANLVTIQANGAELIDYPGTNTKIIDAQNVGLTIQSNGTRWVRL